MDFSSGCPGYEACWIYDEDRRSSTPDVSLLFSSQIPPDTWDLMHYDITNDQPAVHSLFARWSSSRDPSLNYTKLTPVVAEREGQAVCSSFSAFIVCFR
jgi:hypothetical protein